MTWALLSTVLVVFYFILVATLAVITGYFWRSQRRSSSRDIQLPAGKRSSVRVSLEDISDLSALIPKDSEHTLGPWQKRLSLLSGAEESGVRVDKPHVQTGYRRSAMSFLGLVLWIVTPILGQAFIICFVLDMNGFSTMGMSSGDSSNILQPWLVIMFLYFIVLGCSTQRGLLYRSFMIPCSLADADLVVISIETGVDAMQETLCSVEENDGHRFYTFMCYRYVYMSQSGYFRPAGRLDFNGSEANSQLEGGGCSNTVATERRSLSGTNEIIIEVPGIVKSLFNEFHAYFYMYQLFVINMWCMFACWNFAVTLTILLTLTGVYKALWVTRANNLEIQRLAKSAGDHQVLRNSTWCRVPAEEIVPGDVIVLESEMTMPADCVLIRGGTVMHEAMLTGEPLPITKVPIGNNVVKPQSANMLYCGTDVMDVAGSGADERTIGIVQAIGGATMKGNLLRLVLFPCSTVFQYELSIPKVYAALLSLAFVYALLMLIVPHPFNTGFGGDLTLPFVKGLFVVQSAITPLIGIAVTLGQVQAVANLRRRSIKCLVPQKVAVAGVVDTMVLDKTGTITHDGMELHGLQLWAEGSFSKLVHKSDIASLQDLHRFFMASCHKLTPHRDSVVGNHVEMEMFCSLVGWSIQLNSEGRFVTDGQNFIQIMRVLDFDHTRMTSGCVCKLPDDSIRVFIKGAASVIQGLCQDSSDTFLSTAETWSAQCYYVLGCATKLLATADKIEDEQRADLEQGLSALGLLLFKNELKPDSAAAIADLQAGNTTCVMCTGDDLLTGINVGKRVGILPQANQILRLEANQGKLVWLDFTNCVDHREAETMSFEAGVSNLSALYVMEQKQLEVLKTVSYESISTVFPRVRVLGRVKPEGKVQVVKEFQNLQRVVGMCGDGGNDCGALRAADVGLALSSAESSIVAPFSAGQSRSLLCVVDLLKEGRACLANNIAAFCFFLAYGVTISTTYLSLTLRNDGSMGEHEYIYIIWGVAFCCSWAMSACQPSDVLSPFRPTGTLLCMRIVCAALGAWFLYVLFLLMSWMLLFAQDFYMYWNPKELGLSSTDLLRASDNFEAEVCFLVVAWSLPVQAVVNSYGSHHRQTVIYNWRLLGVVMFSSLFIISILLSDSSDVHNVLRVQTSSLASMQNHGPVMSFIQALSANPIGGCFYGPQMQKWANTTISASIRAGLVQKALKSETCVPPQYYWESATCTGTPEFANPARINNVLDVKYRVILLICMLGYCLLAHLFQAKILLNPFFDKLESKATGLNSTKPQEAEIELINVRDIQRW